MVSKQGRKLSAPVQRAILTRDDGQCTFVSRDGVRCAETRRLEFDHIHPVALGGGENVEAKDIRLLCKTHNLHQAKKHLGLDFMKKKIDQARSTRSSTGAERHILGPARGHSARSSTSAEHQQLGPSPEAP